MKRFTIIIPAHNCETTLEQCVESVVQNGGNNHEIIIVENGSTDNTVAICKTLQNTHNNIIFLQCVSGPSQARNIGLENATGDYIIFLDSDDFVIGSLNNAEQQLQTGFDMYFFHHKTVDSKNNYSNPYYKIAASAIQGADGKAAYIELYNKHFIPTGPCVFVYKREHIAQHNLRFDENIFLGEDACFVTSCLWQAQTVGMLSESLICFRQAQGGSLSSTINEKSLKNIYLSWQYGLAYSKGFSQGEQKVFLCPYINSALWFMQKLHTMQKSELQSCKVETNFITAFLISGYKLRHRAIGIACKIFGIVHVSKLLSILRR